MSNTYRSILFASACLAALGALPGAATAADAPGLLVLFDGKSLDGWAKTDFAHSGDVKVEDGAIVLATGRSMTGITTTRRDLPTTNYELTYEAVRLEGHDFFAAATFPVGKSHITLVGGGWGGNVTGLSSLDGQDASENETTCFVKYQNGTPYRFRVWVTDKVIRCWVDDMQVVAVNIEDRQVDTRIETDANKPLGFATYESTGALRTIRIRRLTPAEIAQNNQAAQ
jgi:hypothetical protein